MHGKCTVEAKNHGFGGGTKLGSALESILLVVGA